ncbi:hypothetical protein PVAP13_4KG297100 [Panicum virgatum]|uniref:Uncharacterized protein n=1 Tax=Panicum virgatum TaxID=38727 RepID=A0A8T0TUY8_PANVG|nr:hypothetical protein PVAP13_4KG297100 [Panicum virgatum]
MTAARSVSLYLWVILTLLMLSSHFLAARRTLLACTGSSLDSYYGPPCEQPHPPIDPPQL